MPKYFLRVLISMQQCDLHSSTPSKPRSCYNIPSGQWWRDRTWVSDRKPNWCKVLPVGFLGRPMGHQRRRRSRCDLTQGLAAGCRDLRSERAGRGSTVTETQWTTRKNASDEEDAKGKCNYCVWQKNKCGANLPIHLYGLSSVVVGHDMNRISKSRDWMKQSKRVATC